MAQQKDESAQAHPVCAATLAPARLPQSWMPHKSFRSCQAAAEPLRSGHKFLLFAAVWERERLLQPLLLLPILHTRVRTRVFRYVWLLLLHPSAFPPGEDLD